MNLKAVRQTYTTWAPLYDAMHGWLPKRRAARLALGARPGDRVLDLACGTGGNVAVHEGDAAALPFLDGSFDRTFCSYAMNIIPDERRAIAEVERVLVPGGRFVDLEMMPMRHGPPGWLTWLPHLCAVAIDTTRRSTSCGACL